MPHQCPSALLKPVFFSLLQEQQPYSYFLLHNTIYLLLGQRSSRLQLSMRYVERSAYSSLVYFEATTRSVLVTGQFFSLPIFVWFLSDRQDQPVLKDSSMHCNERLLLQIDRKPYKKLHQRITYRTAPACQIR